MNQPLHRGKNPGEVTPSAFVAARSNLQGLLRSVVDIFSPLLARFKPLREGIQQNKWDKVAKANANITIL